MTTGSYDRGSYTTVSGGRIGLELTKSWSGPDSPPAAKIPYTWYTTYRRVSRGDGVWSNKTYLKKFKYRLPVTSTASDLALASRKRRQENPYSVTYFKHKVDGMQMQAYLSNAVWSPLYVPLTGANTGLVSLFSANDEIRLVNKLKERLQGSDFNMSVFLGEGHQTVKMLGDSAIRIAKGLYFAKKGDIKGAARALLEGSSRAPLKNRHAWDPRHPAETHFPNFKGDAKNAANIWLELQYGWRPLVNDAEAAAHALAHHLSVPARKSYRVKINRNTVVWGNAPQTDYRTFGYCKQSLAKGHTRWILARIAESDLPTTVQKLGLQDPELVAWELLPFSFVADWFIPIGGWMEARAMASRLRGTFIYSDKKTVKADMSAAGRVYTPGPKGYMWRTPWPMAGWCYERVSFDRTISTVLKVPMPEFKPLSKVASWQHCANAVALLTQVFTKPGVNLSPKQRGVLTSRSSVLPEHYWSK
nr:MAG: hypothetical protein 1 [Leviviridae sp.]